MSESRKYVLDPARALELLYGKHLPDNDYVPDVDGEELHDRALAIVVQTERGWGFTPEEAACMLEAYYRGALSMQECTEIALFLPDGRSG